jgi:histone H3/H4
MNKKETRKLLKEYGLNTGTDLFEGLDRLTFEALNRASERAKANKRKTVYARDL